MGFVTTEQKQAKEKAKRLQQLKRIAAQIKKWNLGVYFEGTTPPDACPLYGLRPVIFGNMKSAIRGGRLLNRREYWLSIDDMMTLAGLCRVPHHPVWVEHCKRKRRTA